MALVSLEDVSKHYRLDGQDVAALSEVTLSIEQGVFLAIAGPSGSGKSTLLNLLGCIDNPTSGRVVIDGRDVSSSTPDELAGYRARTVGFIFQNFNLFPVLTAWENVEYPLLQFRELSSRRRRDHVAQHLEMVGLARFAAHRPSQLSGGQRQRVAIARALAVRPKLVLADEPTANLDHATGSEILALMKGLNRKLGTTFVFSTHDPRVMAAADRLVRIEDGRVVGLGMRRQGEWVFVHPRTGREAARAQQPDLEVSTVIAPQTMPAPEMVPASQTVPASATEPVPEAATR